MSIWSCLRIFSADTCRKLSLPLFFEHVYTGSGATGCNGVSGFGFSGSGSFCCGGGLGVGGGGRVDAADVGGV